MSESAVAGPSPIALTAAMALVTRYHLRLTHSSDARLGELADGYELGAAAWTGKRSAFVGFFTPDATDALSDIQSRVAAATRWGVARLAQQPAEACDILLVGLGPAAGAPRGDSSNQPVRVSVITVDPTSGEVSELMGGARGLPGVREMRSYVKPVGDGSAAPTLAAVDLAEREAVRGGYVQPARTALISTPYVTYGLIASWVAIFVIQQVLRGATGRDVSDAFGTLYAGQDTTVEWWRLIASGFIHDNSNVFHLAGNSLAMFFLGRSIEQLYGRLAILASFLICVLGGSLLTWALADAGLVTSTVGGMVYHDVGVLGASGGIFGLLGILLVVGRVQGKGLAPGLASGIRSFAITRSVLFMAYTFLIPGIAWYGHIGGFITGILVGLVLPPLRALGGRELSAYEKAVMVIIVALSGVALVAAGIHVIAVAAPTPGTIPIPS